MGVLIVDFLSHFNVNRLILSFTFDYFLYFLGLRVLVLSMTLERLRSTLQPTAIGFTSRFTSG